MGIVHLTFSLGTGGAENLLVDIANEQINNEQVLIIIINDKLSEDIIDRIDDRIEIIYLKRKEASKRNFSFLFKLWYFLFFKKPRVIHCHNHNAIPLLPIFQKKSVITVHDVGEPTKNLKKFKKVFSISDAVSNDLKKAKIKSIIIKNGINFSLYHKRENYTIKPGSKFKIIQISRLMHEKKGQDILLKALHILVYSYGLKDISIDFVGAGPSDDYLKDLSNKLTLENYVNFRDERERTWIQQKLSTYHSLIQPSRYEGFGLTILEGIAAGIPVIASNIDGPAEILEGISSGFLFDLENADSLAYYLKKVFNLYTEGKIKELCDKAYKEASVRYSVRQTAFSYLNNY